MTWYQSFSVPLGSSIYGKFSFFVLYSLFVTLLFIMASTGASYSSAALGSNTAPPILDVNHPYYLHPSDNPGLVITTVVLDESNFSQWHRSMEIALSSKLKLGFVDGSYIKPAVNSPLSMHWIRCNNMVTSWLLISVSIPIRQSIVYMKSAKAIWDDLQVRYAQTNVPKLINLRKEISHLDQGAMTISAYFIKFRTIHDELECLHSNPRCTCNHCTCTVNSRLDAQEQTIQLTQFLMGLSDQFTGIRGQILLMTPLPTMSQCYAMLLQEESQRGVTNAVVPSADNSSAMSVKYKPSPGNKPFKKPTAESPIYCEYCHMQGHVKDKCFCLHGYPPWHKLHGKPKPKPKHLAASSSTTAPTHNINQPASAQPDSGGSVSTCAPALPFSEGQYQHLVQML